MKYLADESYQAVIIETDDGNLPNRHQAAQTAVDNRLYELQLDDGSTPEERPAISDAITGLTHDPGTISLMCPASSADNCRNQALTLKFRLLSIRVLQKNTDMEVMMT